MTTPDSWDVEIQVDQNEYLPPGGRVMDAVVSVRLGGDGLAAPDADPAVAQVLMLDCSSSMHGSKIAEAKKAAVELIGTLRDGVSFAIVAGTGEARQVFPPGGGLAVVTPEVRERAALAVRALHANGGTAIGSWLRMAADLLRDSPARIRHGLLLTDGHNEHETPEGLARALEACKGVFGCDCRGVGTGWSADPLDAVADALLGSARGLPDPAELAADFRAVGAGLMRRSLAGAALRLWTPARARVRFLKQVYPRLTDLTDRAVAVDERRRDYPTGDWGAETRDFHLSVEVPSGEVDEWMVAARVRLAAHGWESAQRNVLVRWTDDLALSSRIDSRVAGATGQADLAEAIREGLDAEAAGDLDRATACLGRAYELAKEAGNTRVLDQLDQVVEPGEAPGAVVLRRSYEAVVSEMLKVESKTTTRVDRSGGGDADLR